MSDTIDQSPFIPPTPVTDTDSGSRWRNIISAAILVVLIVGTGSIFIAKNNAGALKEVQKTGTWVLSALEPLVPSAIGGDIQVVPPPVILPPPRPELIDASSTPQQQFTAAEILVKDKKTGAVLYEKNAYAPHSIASITKLMSALVILETKPDFTATTTAVSESLADTYMYGGDVHTLDEFWRAALIGSSNKSIMSLANAVGWSEDAFVARMNEKAREFGMTDSSFVEPTGLMAENMATASDVAQLLAEALSHDEIKTILEQREYNLYSNERGKTQHIWSTNWLLLRWIPHTFATPPIGKTGYIPDSGYNFASEITDDRGHTLDVVILGADVHEARFAEARDIANWVFKNYSWPEDATTTPAV